MRKVVVRDYNLFLAMQAFGCILNRPCPSGESLRKSAWLLFPVMWSGAGTSFSHWELLVPASPSLFNLAICLPTALCRFSLGLCLKFKLTLST